MNGNNWILKIRKIQIEDIRDNFIIEDILVQPLQILNGIFDKDIAILSIDSMNSQKIITENNEDTNESTRGIMEKLLEKLLDYNGRKKRLNGEIFGNTEWETVKNNMNIYYGKDGENTKETNTQKRN